MIFITKIAGLNRQNSRNLIFVKAIKAKTRQWAQIRLQ